MKLIQLSKIFFLIAGISSLSFSKTVKPNGNENFYKLIINTEEGNKVRPYYLLDNDGLEYTNFKNFKPGENINLQVVSRTNVASSSNSKKKYKFDLIIMDGKKTILERELSYNKKASNVTSPDKKGFNFTLSGYWFENITVTKNTKVILKSKIKGQKIYIRLLANKNDKKNRDNSKIYPVDHQKNLSISFKDKGETLKSSGWFLVSSENKQQFMLNENDLIRVFVRQIGNINPTEGLIVYENNQWIGNYIFDFKESLNSAYIASDYLNLNNKSISSYNSFYLSVPSANDKNYSYYTFDVKTNSKFLIKLVKYEIEK